MSRDVEGTERLTTTLANAVQLGDHARHPVVSGRETMEAGPRRFDRWSITYDQNMTRATKAHQRADAYRDELGWGEREVPVMAGNDKRILDIADRALSRGVEVKTGYVPLSADVAYELKRDAWLVSEENWDIRWFVDGRMSEPLRKALRAANIQFTETKPTTLIKDL